MPGKRTIKYGGKSGILPKPRPIFKNPIRPKTPEELSELSKIEQGYAENIPLPKKKGFKFYRTMVEKPVITVEERIKKTIESVPKVDMSKLNDEEKWKVQANEIRRQHLKQAYLKEYERLKDIDEFEKKKHELDREKQKTKKVFEESNASKLTLPTLESYLNGPIVKQRTENEQNILNKRKIMNRKLNELEVEERKAMDLLNLYHSSSKFITNEEQLQKAIIEAFQSDVNKFESAYLSVKDKLRGFDNPSKSIAALESMFLDSVVGESNGKPGLDIVKDTIDGEIERLRRQAELVVNKD